MKTFILISLITLLITKISYSQLPQDYPFKIIIDDLGFVYLTGELEGDIMTQKFDQSLNEMWREVLHNPGLDRGMDVTINSEEDVIVAGYITNPTPNNFDIITIKYTNSNGNLIWTKRYDNTLRDDKAYGILVDEDRNIYITGYVTNKYNKKDIIILKYSSDSTFLQSAIYENKKFRDDDVATDIVLDARCAYVVGSTYQGNVNLNDIVMLTFLKHDLSLSSVQIYQKPNTNEIATGYTLVNASRNVLQKSHSAVIAVTDNPLPGSSTKNPNYLTLFFNNDENTTLLWAKTFNGADNTDVPTSISASNTHVYVTGYSYRSGSNPYDFATIKYDTANGSYGWSGADSIRYYDTLSGVDKGSSIKVKNNDTVYIAGTSSNAPNGFKIAKYKQSNPQIWAADWKKTFYPSFTQIDNFPEMQSAAVIELDSLGNVYLITYAWNEIEKYYAIRKYDSQGNELFTLDENQFDKPDQFNFIDKLDKEFNLSQNFPNPFNPITTIIFNIPIDAHIQLKVYDISGREVANLINEFRTAGQYKIEFDGSSARGGLASGVYYYKLKAGDYQDIKKMIILK